MWRRHNDKYTITVKAAPKKTYVKLAIEYKDGRSTILNLTKKMEYETGEILCEIFAGNALYIMRDKARVYPFYFPDVDAALLAKVLSNPEMAAMLTTLAKTLESK